MTTDAQFVKVLPTEKVAARDMYRVTWAVTKTANTLAAATLGALKVNIPNLVRFMYEGRITATGLAYPATMPAVAPGDDAATMDVRIVASVPTGTTVAALAQKLDDITGSPFFKIIRLEKLSGTATAAQSEQQRADVTATADAAAEASYFGDVFGFVEDALQKAVIVVAIGGALYWLVTSGTYKKLLKK